MPGAAAAPASHVLLSAAGLLLLGWACSREVLQVADRQCCLAAIGPRHVVGGQHDIYY
jgi:hypothetical protein